MSGAFYNRDGSLAFAYGDPEFVRQATKEARIVDVLLCPEGSANLYRECIGNCGDEFYTHDPREEPHCRGCMFRRSLHHKGTREMIGCAEAS